MSGSETGGVITSREPFTVGAFQKTSPPAPSQPVVQNMRLAYSGEGTAVYKPFSGSSPPFQPTSASVEAPAGGLILPHSLNMNTSDSIKRKRGRPRKYGADGTMALALTPPAVTVNTSGGSFSPPPGPPAAAGPPSGGLASPNSLKKGRGRPRGSSKKQQLEALGSAGIGFTPHVITVKAGEVSFWHFYFP
ncbi:unnamed protein product [Ilex paraguariensis]|uniref:AT-hook motif nuclear-localized protein n=1 Tax=Ilex paraguariensis TaxID=185542 RepID=A0ABC8T6X8_9AQUA